MKAIHILHAGITRVSSAADNGVSMSVVTPELAPEQAATILRLKGQNVQVLITPIDEPGEEPELVSTDRDAKSPAQRLRGVLFVCHKALRHIGKTGEEFDAFYRNKLEAMIEAVKSKLAALGLPEDWDK